MKKLNKLPEWFNGIIYDKGETVTNPFSGDTYKLTNLELSMYDFIIGAQMVLEIPALSEEKQIEICKNMSKGISWFRRNNGKAYMVLLD